MFNIDGHPIINTRSLIEKFDLDGRNTDLLRMANGQHFKYIDGVGEGAFLLKQEHVPTGKTCVLSVFNSLESQGVSGSASNPSADTPIKYILVVKDKFVFNIQPSQAVVLVYTKELKYELEETFATRNYNVIDARSPDTDEVYIVHPDRTPKHIDEIINEYMPSAQVIFPSTVKPIPYNFFIQGMNFVQIMDLYCKAYGLVWNVYATPEEPELKIHIHTLQELNPDHNNLVSDVNLQYDPSPAFIVETIHPIVDCCLKSPQQYINKTNTEAGLKTIQIYCPYYPAIVDPSSTEPVETETGFEAQAAVPTNSIQLNECSEFIAENLHNYSAHENNYYVNNYIFPIDPSTAPKQTELRYYHNGYGYRTISFSGRYTGLPIPQSKPFDQQARNVVGQITFEYKKVGSTAPTHFFVTPLYGLDGWIDTEINLHVRNLYKWDYGAENAIVRIEWDCNNREWIPLQQEYICPPDEDPPPLPEPSDEEPKITLEWKE